MHNSFYVMILCLAVAGCGADHPPTTGAGPEASSATTAKSASRAARLPQAGIDSALAAISSKAPLNVRYDRIVQDKAGKNQRQVFVEMLGASAAQTEVLTTNALTSSGFTVRRGKADAQGIRLQYRKRGIQPINVLIRDKNASPPLKAAKATSSLYLKQTAI